MRTGATDEQILRAEETDGEGMQWITRFLRALSTFYTTGGASSADVIKAFDQHVETTRRQLKEATEVEREKMRVHSEAEDAAQTTADAHAADQHTSRAFLAAYRERFDKLTAAIEPVCGRHGRVETEPEPDAVRRACVAAEAMDSEAFDSGWGALQEAETASLKCAHECAAADERAQANVLVATDRRRELTDRLSNMEAIRDHLEQLYRAESSARGGGGVGVPVPLAEVIALDCDGDADSVCGAIAKEPAAGTLPND